MESRLGVGELVEAGGVEPPSEQGFRQGPTCLVALFNLAAWTAERQAFHEASSINLTGYTGTQCIQPACCKLRPATTHRLVAARR